MVEGKEVAPCVYLYENAIDNCEELIGLAMQNSGWSNGTIGESTLNKEIRDVQVLPIPPLFKNDIRWFEVAQKMWQYGNQYSIIHDVYFSDMEHPQFLRYLPSESFYSPHADDGKEMNRVFSAVLYLNDVDEGGETHFNRFNLSVKPKRGRLIIFPANYVYLHEARNTKSNEKYAIVTWFNG